MFAWLVQTWEDAKLFMYSIMLTFLDALKDIMYWLLESILDLVVVILDGLGSLFDGLNITQYINGIPPTAAYFASASGLGQALGMIVTALTIRFLLQLIPFTRLGS
ncbi:DUF2523 family protein [Pseudoalteromonas sp. S2755]|uniref:DUF2523 family protein n=1 Tax=Pseudoalteromonas sp. S2755 TaxID=2066523 RepID=UPI00110A47DF|nr:DUF2523 family protein [Pseudoalteromonas sp. S2755]TMN33718.1 hypothetical protein CWC03_18420 [Pseudoalteromonas sp. S2755]